MHADFRLGRAAALLPSLLSLAQAFYVPGWSIKSYSDGETIPLFVNKVFSDNTQLSYAYTGLPFVCPASGRKYGGSHLTSGSSVTLNLGEILRGDRIVMSDYELIMGNDEEVRYLCSHEVDRKGIDRARELIRDGYVAEWIVDNLPGATSFVTTDNSRKYYTAGFKLGYQDFSAVNGQPRYHINNHVTLVIRYHRAAGRAGDRGKKVIVGFEVYPKSIEAGNRNETTGLPNNVAHPEHGMELRIGTNTTREDNDYLYPYLVEDAEADPYGNATLTIPYTYSVYFREDERLEWQNRWDMFFVNQEENTKIHWFAIINALIMMGLLTAVVAVIFTRTVRADVKSYKETVLEDAKVKIKRSRPRTPRKSIDKGSGLLDQLDADMDADVSSDEEPMDDVTGWKLLHGDVFRAPAYSGLLAPLVGSGSQLVFMAAGLILLSCIGVLNPSFRGGYISVGITLFIIAGVFSGYFSGRVYKTFGGQLWKKNFIITGTLIPGLLFSTVFILNLFTWAQASSTAIPFGTLVALLTLWLLIQLPLVYIGNWYGYVKVGAWNHPVKTNVIPRQVPAGSWYTKSMQAVLVAGVIPFAVIFVELMFVFKNLWQDKSGYYYVFGFLAVTSVILFITIIEVSIIATYVQICAENYHWWWQSFFAGGGSAVWVFLYCVWYYFTRLHVSGFVSCILFFSYSFLACAVYGLLTGTIGFLASYAFVRRIYGAIKAD